MVASLAVALLLQYSFLAPFQRPAQLRHANANAPRRALLVPPQTRDEIWEQAPFAPRILLQRVEELPAASLSLQALADRASRIARFALTHASWHRELPPDFELDYINLVERAAKGLDLAFDVMAGSNASANLQAVTGITPDLVERVFYHHAYASRSLSDLSMLEYLCFAAPHILTRRDLRDLTRLETQVNKHVFQEAFKWAALIKPWHNVTCGSDLFVRDLRKFDIAATYEAALRSRAPSGVVRFEDARDWIINPQELRVRGHFPRAVCNGESLTPQELHMMEERIIELGRLLQLDENDPRRRNLIRFSDWWNDAEHAAALDELRPSSAREYLYRIDWPEEGDKMPPPQLLRTMRQRREERQEQQWAQLVECREPFPHLANLSDGGLLKVLRTEQDIVLIGKELHNCAAMYAQHVRRGERVLVALIVDGKAKALGAYSGGRFWTEVSESCNRRPSDETLRLYEKYLPTVVRWWRQSPGCSRQAVRLDCMAELENLARLRLLFAPRPEAEPERGRGQ